MIAISCNPADMHKDWVKDINAYANTEVGYPIVADPERKIAKEFGMIPASVRTKKTCRCRFIFGSLSSALSELRSS